MLYEPPGRGQFTVRFSSLNIRHIPKQFYAHNVMLVSLGSQKKNCQNFVHINMLRTGATNKPDDRRSDTPNVTMWYDLSILHSNRKAFCFHLGVNLGS